MFDQMSGNGKEMTLVMGASNLVGGIVGILTVSRFGRRFNLLYGTFIQTVAFGLLIAGYEYKLNVLSIIAVLGYMISFSVGLGGTMPIFCAEIVSAAGVGIGGCMQWVFASLVGKFLPIFNTMFGPLYMLIFFTVMTGLSLVFFNYACVETSGLDREDIELIYEGGTTSKGRSHHFSFYKICSSKSGPRK